jgi:hypothetical protein
VLPRALVVAVVIGCYSLDEACELLRGIFAHLRSPLKSLAPAIYRNRIFNTPAPSRRKVVLTKLALSTEERGVIGVGDRSFGRLLSLRELSLNSLYVGNESEVRH